MVQEVIIPYLQPCDERQLPRSVLVLDNASVHHFSDEEDYLRQMVEEKGAKLLFIPQYTPRANAIEAGFGLMNHFIDENYVPRNP
eukprot:COSAG05_NODE_11476_length_511_cov_7.788835_2_plen_85_part_00